MDITHEFAAKQIIDTMGDVLFVLDRDRIVRVANPAACSLARSSEWGLVGKPLTGELQALFPDRKVAEAERGGSLIYQQP